MLKKPLSPATQKIVDEFAASLDEPSGDYREWIPVRERLPEQAGTYATLVKPLLGEPYEQVQNYTPQDHPAISGWKHMPVTHWRLQ
jgi:hypothetical protein